jgi:hypothetical protein
MTIYRIYTEKNYADTSRDPDDIHIEELGYKSNLDDALDIARAYIKESFINKEDKLREDNNGNYFAHDFRSYGVTIHIKKINVN